MVNQVLKYFRNGLRKRLERPNCGRYLPLWDDEKWKNYVTNINIPYIATNDFLIFLYQTKYDISCIQDENGQVLFNALDKFFYIMFEFETYFNVFLFNNIYENRMRILEDVIKYVQFNAVPAIFFDRLKLKYFELFVDLVKKTNEWNYWIRIIVVTYAKITLTKETYENAERNESDFLRNLISNIQEIFFRGVNNKIIRIQ